MGALFNLLRLYLVWWIFTDWMLRDLPNRHTVAHFAKVPHRSPLLIKFETFHSRLLSRSATLFGSMYGLCKPNLCSLFTILYIHYSLFTIYHSLFTIRYSDWTLRDLPNPPNTPHPYMLDPTPKTLHPNP